MTGWLLLLVAAGAWPAGAQPAAPPHRVARESFACSVVAVIGGDGLRCAETGRDGRPIRIRLAGIRPRGRATAAGLARMALGRVVMCQAAAPDARGPVAYCRRSDGTDLGCLMVATGRAVPARAGWQPQRCAAHRDVGGERIMGGPGRP